MPNQRPAHLVTSMRSVLVGGLASAGEFIPEPLCGRGLTTAVDCNAMQPPEVFVIAPFNPELQPVRDAVHRAAEHAGARVAHVDEMAPGAVLTSSIIDRIRRADLIIADLTGQNSDIMYELGFAHALRKRTILLVNPKSDLSERLPADLAGFEYIFYDPANLDELTDRLRSEIHRMTMRRSA